MRTRNPERVEMEEQVISLRLHRCLSWRRIAAVMRQKGHYISRDVVRGIVRRYLERSGLNENWKSGLPARIPDRQVVHSQGLYDRNAVPLVSEGPLFRPRTCQYPLRAWVGLPDLLSDAWKCGRPVVHESTSYCERHHQCCTRRPEADEEIEEA